MATPESSYCEELVKKGDYYRYLVTLLMDKKHRQKLFSIFAFNDEIAKVKDITSEPITGMIRLQWWRDAIEELFDGKCRKHEVVEALQKTIHAQPIPKKTLLQMIDAREVEIELQQPETMNALEIYCMNTSSNAFKIGCYTAGYHSDTVELASKHFGIAWALIGILRALRFNFRKGYIQLPSQLLEQEGLSNDDLKEGRDLKKLRPIIRAVIGRAKFHLKEGRSLQKDLPKDIKPLFFLSHATDSFIKRIERANYDVLTTSIEEPISPIQLKIYWNSLFSKC
jgi:phytoene synthase